MVGLMQVFSFVLAIGGLIVCILGMKRHYLYKGGFFMFLFMTLSNLYNLIYTLTAGFIIRFLLEKHNDDISSWLQLIQLPAYILSTAGIVIFIVFAIIGLNKDMEPNNNTYGGQF